MGIERLLSALISVFYFCHFGACSWYFISDFTLDNRSWILTSDTINMTKWEKYFTSLYWVS